MTKKPMRQNLKPAGKCIFCEGGATPSNPMTKEHIWSDWMDGLLPRFANEWFEFIDILAGKTRTASRSYFRSLQGAPKDKTAKVVCKHCNSGWMSLLESCAKPWLTKMIKGEPVVLGVMERIKLMEWIVMKFLVAENVHHRDYPANPIFSQAVRSEFMKSRTIPGGLRVWVAMQQGTKWATGFHLHGAGLAFSPNSPPPPRNHGLPTKTVQVLTWGIGKLLIYLNASTEPKIHDRLDFSGIGPLLRFWPMDSGNIDWPPRFFVSDPFIDDLADAFQQFIASDEVGISP